LPGVTLLRAAIHARTGETLTFVNTHLSHASARLEDGGAAFAGDHTETVETLAIDDLVPPGTPALIKLDVEGAEIAAIDGAARALADGAVLIYEDHGNDPACTVSAHLLGMPGMRVFACGNGLSGMTDIARIRSLKSDPFKGYNFVAAQAGSPLMDAVATRFANPRRSG